MERSGDIAVTGMGLVSPLGPDKESSFEAMLRGESGIALLEPQRKYKGLGTRIGGQLKGFRPEDHFSAFARLQTHRSTQMAEVVVRQAIKDAGFEIGKRGVFAPDRKKSLISGTSVGGMVGLPSEEWVLARAHYEEWSRAASMSTLRSLPERSATYPAMEHGITGPVKQESGACATFALVLSEAEFRLNYRYTRNGLDENDPDATDADLIIVVGTDAGISPLMIRSFNVLGGKEGALSRRNDDPEGASRPYDQYADGFVPAEMAAALLLEPRELAEARGAHIYALYLGGADTCDADRATAVNSNRLADTYRLTLRRSGIIIAKRIDIAFNAHATSTLPGDKGEATAVKIAFGDKAKDIPISAMKGYFGHGLGPCAGGEIVMGLMAMEKQIVIANRNLHNRIPEAEGLFLVEPELVDGELRYYRPWKYDVMLKASSGFGGINSVHAFRLYQ
ncbi:beta-ketoacyl-[acyl-carrier-protein] synthase family protein [Candidatus Daviesbacteria bacterium]|nr:beta-ketoacyl-[acyl-carrier-protein] synthase family protein [Candidatus Daviesbacteria bacterium]